MKNASRGLISLSIAIFLLLAPHPARAKDVTVFTGNGSDQSADVRRLFSRDGHYLFKGIVRTQSVAVKGKRITIDFAPGARLEPAAKVDVLWGFTDSDVVIGTLRIDGRGLAQRAFNQRRGTLAANDIEIVNMGYPETMATSGVFGVFLDGATQVKIGRAIFSDFHGVGNGIYGDGIGEVRGFYAQKTGPIEIDRFEMSGGDAHEDNDYFHAQLGTSGGVIHDFIARYNGNTRRVFKAQSGAWMLEHVDVREGTDFAPDSALTQTGTHNLNAIDFAHDGPGSINIKAGYIDCSGFAACVADSGGGGRVTTERDLTLLGSTLKNIRNDAGVGAAKNQDTIGFYSPANDVGSGMNGTTLINFGIGAFLMGRQSFSRGAHYIDPTNAAALLGAVNPTEGIEFSGNTIEARKPGLAPAGRVVEVGEIRDVKILENHFVEKEGGSPHVKKFIECKGLHTTGQAFGNTAPAGTKALEAGICSLN